MTISLACGIVWHAAGFLWWIPFIIFISSSLLVHKKEFLISHQHITLLFLSCFSFLFGITLQAWHEHRLHIQAAELCNKAITLTGKILTINNAASGRFKRSYTIEIINAEKNGKKLSLYRNPALIVYSQDNLTARKGDFITIEKAYIHQPASPGFEQYLHVQNCLGNCFISADRAQISKHNNMPLAQWIDQKRTSLLQEFKAEMPPQTFTLFSLMFLGHKKQSTELEKIRNYFNWWGISHYLARSGLHLVIIIMLIHFLLSFLPLPLNAKQVIVTMFIAIYSLFSWSSVSFLRSFLTTLLYIFCTTTSIAQHTLHILSLVCCAVLIMQPSYLFALDFQLSFGLTLALIIIQEIISLKKGSLSSKHCSQLI